MMVGKNVSLLLDNIIFLTFFAVFAPSLLTLLINCCFYKYLYLYRSLVACLMQALHCSAITRMFVHISCRTRCTTMAVMQPVSCSGVMWPMLAASAGAWVGRSAVKFCGSVHAVSENDWRNQLQSQSTYDRWSAFVVLEVRRSKVKVMQLSDALLPWVHMSIWLL